MPMRGRSETEKTNGAADMSEGSEQGDGCYPRLWMRGPRTSRREMFASEPVDREGDEMLSAGGNPIMTRIQVTGCVERLRFQPMQPLGATSSHGRDARRLIRLTKWR